MNIPTKYEVNMIACYHVLTLCHFVNLFFFSFRPWRPKVYQMSTDQFLYQIRGSSDQPLSSCKS